MQWELEYGSKESHMNLYLSLQQKGRPSPLDFKPTIDDVIDWFLMAFGFLSRSRQYNGAPQHITISEMIALTSGIGCIGTLEEFIYIMQEIDSAYISHVVKKEGEDDG